MSNKEEKARGQDRVYFGTLFGVVKTGRIRVGYTLLAKQTV